MTVTYLTPSQRAEEELNALTQENLIELGRIAPDVLLKWVYQNLNNPTLKYDPAWAEALQRGAINCTNTYIDPEFSLCLQLRWYPVDIETFMFDAKYLNKDRREIYPEVLQELKQINNPGGRRVTNPYSEGLFTGGIGSAKSTTALYTTAYQLYLLSCFESPHAAFNLDTSSEMVFVFLSVAGDAATTDYNRFYAMLEKTTYFNVDFPFNRSKRSEMHFPHNIQILAGIDAIGKNVIGGMIDEVNFGAIVQNSKRSMDGGTYNQILVMYNGLARRRKSRFMRGGTMPGILCLVSSKRYPGEFTDVKMEEAKTDKSIYVYDKRVWDIKPKNTYCGETFSVFPGSVQRKACIYDAQSMQLSLMEMSQLVQVPIEYSKEFKDDLVGSLRDIAGVSTLARYPFFQNVNAVASCFGKRQSVLSHQATDFETSILEFFPKRFKDTHCPRWVHVDLGLVSDSAGITCGYVPKFVLTEDEVGMMPQINIDFILRAMPPLNGEIKFHKIRKLLTALRDHGLPIKWVSFDAFQSVDSIQLLRQVGFHTGRIPIEKNDNFYPVLKTAMYSGRVHAPEHNFCQSEVLRLEKDQKNGKVDHPADGSKDCSDSLSGVVYGLTTRREIWVQHNVPFNQMYASVKEVEVKNEHPASA